MQQVEQGSVRKRQRGVLTARRILDEAAALFARHGFGDVPVRTIAAAAGVRESAVYNHFSGKQAILDTLYDEFIRLVPQTRPGDDALARMMDVMSPEEVFKAILFHVGESVNGTLANTALIISREKYSSPRAAEMYCRYVVEEPSLYYERLITRMAERGMVRPADARLIAQQYNYVSIALTHEYMMAQNGLGDVRAAVQVMVRTIGFFCGLMKGGRGDGDAGNGG